MARAYFAEEISACALRGPPAQWPRRCLGSGIPMQVVVPSVSRADLLQGTAFTLATDATSPVALPEPVLAF
jgi:hypothetical protein